MTNTNGANWAAIPGNFNSTYGNAMSIQQFSSEFLASHKVKEMLKLASEEGADHESILKHHFDLHLGTET